MSAISTLICSRYTKMLYAEAQERGARVSAGNNIPQPVVSDLQRLSNQVSNALGSRLPECFPLLVSPMWSYAKPAHEANEGKLCAEKIFSHFLAEVRRYLSLLRP